MIPVNEPLFSEREKGLLAECIDTGWISSDGPFVKSFERAFADFIGVKHAVAVSNGTAALELAIASLRLEPGSGIILPSFTIISCASAAVRNNLDPILVDVDPETWCIDVQQVEQKIRQNKHIKAIMPVHMYGHPCEMDPLLELAEAHDLFIIEDAAEVHGAEYKGKKCGSQGDVAAFSFYANKIITTGEGGMVLTDDGNLAERARSIRNLCFKPEQRFLHEELGQNLRMSNLQAAVGLAQTERVDQLVERKIRQGEMYHSRLKEIAEIQLQTVKEWAKPVYWVNGLVIEDGFPGDARSLAEKLLEKGVQTRPFFWPLHEQPVLRKMGLFTGERHFVSERLARRGLYLPSGMALTDAQIDTVCDLLIDCLRKCYI